MKTIILLWLAPSVVLTIIALLHLGITSLLAERRALRRLRRAADQRAAAHYRRSGFTVPSTLQPLA